MNVPQSTQPVCSSACLIFAAKKSAGLLAKAEVMILVPAHRFEPIPVTRSSRWIRQHFRIGDSQSARFGGFEACAKRGSEFPSAAAGC